MTYGGMGYTRIKQSAINKITLFIGVQNVMGKSNSITWIEDNAGDRALVCDELWRWRNRTRWCPLNTIIRVQGIVISGVNGLLPMTGVVQVGHWGQGQVLILTVQVQVVAVVVELPKGGAFIVVITAMSNIVIVLVVGGVFLSEML